MTYLYCIEALPAAGIRKTTQLWGKESAIEILVLISNQWSNMGVMGLQLAEDKRN